MKIYTLVASILLLPVFTFAQISTEPSGMMAPGSESGGDVDVTVLYELEDVESITSEYVDPIEMAMDDEYYIYVIVLKTGATHEAEAAEYTLLESRVMAIRNTGYVGDVDELLEMIEEVEEIEEIEEVVEVEEVEEVEEVVDTKTKSSSQSNGGEESSTDQESASAAGDDDEGVEESADDSTTNIDLMKQIVGLLEQLKNLINWQLDIR